MALIRGTKYNNFLNGTDDDDMFAGLGGDDTLNGGLGTDTSWYSGNLSGYSFASVDGRLVVRDTVPADGSDGRDSLNSIEILQFGNGQLGITASEFRVNTYTTNNQDSPTITALADGGFIVSWSSLNQDGSSYGVYAQRYNSAGRATGIEFRVNTYTTSSQSSSSITALADGGFIVSWSSLNQDGSNSGVHARRYDAAGQTVGSEFQVNTYTTGDQSASSIMALSDGGFVVSWSSSGPDGSSTGICAQRYDTAGVAVGSEFQVNAYTTGSQTGSSIAALLDGGFVVSWETPGQDGDSSGVIAKRYDAAGVAVGSEFQVNTYTTGNQYASSITALSDGGFVISWTSDAQDGSSYGIYAQRYNAAGQAVGSEFLVNTYTNSSQSSSSIAALSDGGFVVGWTSNGQDGSLYGIFAQRYDAAGQTVGPEFKVSTYTTGNQSSPSIVALADGGFVVNWASDGQDNSSYGIYAQRYDANGDPVGLKLTGTYGADTINLDPGQLLTVDGAQGNDDIRGSSGDDVLLGGSGNDKLAGNAGNDSLDGGEGTDTMIGGLGDDDYYVGILGDKLTEAAGAGNDSVFASVGWTLAANFENLTLTGSGNINGTGNAFGNLLEGNSGNNILDGKAGADILAGGKGDDTYLVDNVYDYVSENESSGTDLVKTSVTFTLGDNIENLIMNGSAAINAYGNDLANYMTGNGGANVLGGASGNDNLSGLGGADSLYGGDGNDWLIGGLGADTLSGGAGADTFRFDTAFSAANVDLVTDFSSVDDTINILQTLVANAGGAGILSAGEFISMDNHAANNAHHMIYDTTSGGLYYNADGAGNGAAVLIATFQGTPAISNTDIMLA